MDVMVDMASVVAVLTIVLSLAQHAVHCKRHDGWLQPLVLSSTFHLRYDKVIDQF